MKKFFIGLFLVAFFAVGLPLAIEAHPNCRRHSHKKKAYASRYYAPRYATRGYSYQRPSFYQRNRNLSNIAIATGGGALLGGLIGGNRKGIGVGALVGAGSGALYTYVLRPKKRRY